MKKDFLGFMKIVKGDKAMVYKNVHTISKMVFRRCHDLKLPKNHIDVTY